MRAAEAAAVSFSAEPTTMHSPSSIDASSLPEPDLASPSARSVGARLGCVWG
jgi:hypothetical protein